MNEVDYNGFSPLSLLLASKEYKDDELQDYSELIKVLADFKLNEGSESIKERLGGQKTKKRIRFNHKP